MLLHFSPLATGALATLALVAFAVVAAVAARVIRGRPADESVHLPQGADAALWSIVEAVPDPRNHLALTRDLSGEVRITDEDRAAAAALAADRPTVARQHAPGASGVTVIELRESATSATTGNPRPRGLEPDDDDARLEREVTAQLFFTGEPRLTRF